MPEAGHQHTRRFRHGGTGETVRLASTPDALPLSDVPFRFLYMQFLSLDACFRVKRYDVSDESKDPIMDEGLAYFVPDKPYKELVKRYKTQAPVSTSRSHSKLRAHISSRRFPPAPV